ncbi:hypothetical protein ACQPZZ_05120 [Microbispora sp. CA-135349]|uniref:hypothetical protein n=1 Tax=Microbispora sp. CA-135349 TaxID=3239953 RepID=UPI003D914BBA
MRRLTDRGLADLKKLAPHATGTVVAFYGDPRAKDMVMILGVSAPVSDPGATSKGFAAGMGTKVGRMKRVQPGPLGGVAQCGDATFVANVTSGVCTWADGDTRGMIVTYYESGDRAARDFVKMRNEIERRG